MVTRKNSFSHQRTKFRKIEDTILQLPEELYAIIFQFLLPNDRLKLWKEMICSAFHEVLSSEIIWNDLLLLIETHVPTAYSQNISLIDKIESALRGGFDSLICESVCGGENCHYGSSDAPLYSFEVDLPTYLVPIQHLTARHILQALSFENSWSSVHIRDLDVTFIKYPGYRPSTANDEIHNEVEHNYIFHQQKCTRYELLKQYLKGNSVWFVSHHDNYETNYVDLFAVGRSPFTDRLVGGVCTNQECSNLCD
jgi:hypothetical protein